MSELMRAMIGCITVTTVVMGTLTFLMRSYLLRRLKKSLRDELAVQIDQLRHELRAEFRQLLADSSGTAPPGASG
ncbi:MAG: hypothetical protein JNL18_06240 [Planctomycetaceae bacterium]|nr:hypothetical protein [Planctomycetaceae bacterium]